MFTRHSLCTKHGFDLFAGIFGVPLVDNVPEWRKFIAFLLTVHHVVDCNKANPLLLKQYLGIVPDHDVVSSESRHILDDDRLYFTALNITEHPLKRGAIKVSPRIPVIHIEHRVQECVRLCIRL